MANSFVSPSKNPGKMIAVFAVATLGLAVILLGIILYTGQSATPVTASDGTTSRTLVPIFIPIFVGAIIPLFASRNQQTDRMVSKNAKLILLGLVLLTGLTVLFTFLMVNGSI